MKAMRRFAALAMQSAILTMSLVGSGAACDGGKDHSAHMADMAMADMPMRDVAMADMPGMPASAGDEKAPSPHSDCSFPWSSGDCTGMTSCAPSVMGVEQFAAVSVIDRIHDEPASRVEHLRSVTRAPEPPPPRA